MCLPVKKLNKYTKPFWDDNVKQAYKNELKSRIKWVRHGKSKANNNQLHINYKKAKRTFRRIIRNANQRFINK